MESGIQFSFNGKAVKANCRPDTTVLEWLRGEALARGTKEGCAEGDCGACSVLVKHYGHEQFLPTNSCIMLMGQLEGATLVTVEGLASLNDGAGHKIQQLMAENGSSQCGFCTPGIVSSLAGLLTREGAVEESDIHDALAGNLCRCTGYRPIVEAAYAATKEAVSPLPEVTVEQPSNAVGTQECAFYLPRSLDELLQLRLKMPQAVLLAGGTDIALAVAHARERWENVISTRHVAELTEITETSDSLCFGGAVTWQQALPYVTQYWPSFATLIRRFGSTQIRAMGTIAGNLANASPIGDGAPSLLALGATLSLAKEGATRTVPLDAFFLDYRQSALEEGEIISKIHIPLPQQGQEFRAYKVSKRYDQDISTVCGAFALQIENNKIVDVRIAYGGMAATPARCKSAEQSLMQQELNLENVQKAKQAVSDYFTPMSDMRGSAAYRNRVAAQLLDRLRLDLAGEIVEVMGL